MSSARPKGYFNFRFAGMFFLLSAVLEVASATSEVPLFGAMRGGVVAGTYHLVSAAVFTVMGAGLWGLKRWCPTAVLAGSAFYSVDRLIYLSGDRTLGYEQVTAFVEPEMLDSVVLLSTGLTLVCWWGFVAYVFARRDSFTQE